MDENNRRSCLSGVINTLFIAFLTLLIEYFVFQKPNNDGILRFSNTIILATSYLIASIYFILIGLTLLFIVLIFAPIFLGIFLGPIFCHFEFLIKVFSAKIENKKIPNSFNPYKEQLNLAFDEIKENFATGLAYLGLAFLFFFLLAIFNACIDYAMNHDFLPAQMAHNTIIKKWSHWIWFQISNPNEIRTYDDWGDYLFYTILLSYIPMIFLAPKICATVNSTINDGSDGQNS